MDTVAILKLIELCLVASPEIIKLVTEFMQTLDKHYPMQEEKEIALRNILIMITPMEKEK